MRDINQFEQKLSIFIIVILLLKLLYHIVEVILSGDFKNFLVALLIILLVIAGLLYFLRNVFGNLEDDGTFGESTQIGNQRFQALLERYEKLSDDYIEKKQFKKAAYIQLKLLQNPQKAAHILQEAIFYKEAALLYLHKCKDKYNAAKNFEKARSYTIAAKLYKELEHYEAVGDIYTKLNDTKNARHHYKIVVDDYIRKAQYVKASLIYRKKMNDKNTANTLLVKGWRENKDAVNCLNNYFVSFETEKTLQNEIEYFYKYEVNPKNNVHFLNVLEKELRKEIAPKESIQNIAYQMVSKNHQNTDMLNLLKNFIREDERIHQDITRHHTKS